MNKYINLLFKKISLRKIYITIILFSLFGYAVLVSEKKQDIFIFKAIYKIATLPRDVKNVLADLLGNPDRESISPNEFSIGNEFQEIKNNTNFDLRGIKIKTGQNRLYPSKSWRILVGLFDIAGETEYAALAISPDLTVEHVWRIKKDVINEFVKVGGRPFLHGFRLLSDNSIIFSFDSVFASFRIDQCGELIWKSSANLHHAINPALDRKYVWGLVGNDIVKVDVETGKVVQTVSFNNMVTANQQYSVFGIRALDDNALGTNDHARPTIYYADPVHFNDVEPLPAEIADKFPLFEAGDLLISSRSLNMIAVIDPETAKIKWNMIGKTKRQHDPDWNPDGTITVFDNRMGADYSRIVSINPTTNEFKVLVEGEKLNFYSRIRGKHQISVDGSIIVTSAQQGRVFELNQEGGKVLEIIITAPQFENMNYVVTNAFKVPELNFSQAGANPCIN
ncbi:MAG: hypothetical protein H6912_04710 [Kordiimonadaceae bacterium]|nr:hypothetical protein [Kordiimonadaceae bacterium]